MPLVEAAGGARQSPRDWPMLILPQMHNSCHRDAVIVKEGVRFPAASPEGATL
ncbi:MAG: hypothetical protein ACUVTZ_14525 [Armatimonadota bacterium]